MGTGWRRAFCTSSTRLDPEAAATSSSSTLDVGSSSSSSRIKSRSTAKLGGGGGGGGGIFFSRSGSAKERSNPSTPDVEARLLRSTNSTPRCTAAPPPPPPKPLHCKTSTQPTPTHVASTPNSKGGSTPSTTSPRSSSPVSRSPSRLALLKTALRLSRHRCGICGEVVSQRTATAATATAVFTAECSHAFHFPCISSHVQAQGSLVCPVCSTSWQNAPLLSSSLRQHSPRLQQHGDRTLPGNGNGGSRHDRMAKVYDDDESLKQPTPTGRGTAGGVMQFNPIPEEEFEEAEEEEEEVDEDRAPRQLVSAVGVVPDSLAMLSISRNHVTYVLSIKLKAPPLPPRPHNNNEHVEASAFIPPTLLDHPSSRAPIDLVTVLDVSGSMTLAKLQMLKRAMRTVISSLGPGDRLSVVAFSVAAAKRLLPLRRMSQPGQRSARQIVDRLVVCGSSQAQNQTQHCTSSSNHMGDALRKATKVLEDRRERNPVATIMLLSDGGHSQQQHQEEKNVQDSSRDHQSRQPSSATRFAHIEIPIHTSADYNDLQQQKQKRGLKFNNMPPIVEENGRFDCTAKDVHLQLAFHSTCGVISSIYSYSGECIGHVMSHGEGGKSVLLGDMYAEEERRLLVELTVPKTTVLRENSMSISVMFNYRDPLTLDLIHGGGQPFIMPLAIQSPEQDHNSRPNFKFPILLRSSSSSSLTTTTLSTRQQQQQLKNLFVTTRAIAESRRLMELKDLHTAIHLLSSARTFLLGQSVAVSTVQKKLVIALEAQLQDLQRQQQKQMRQIRPHSPSQRSKQALIAEVLGEGGGGEALTPTSAWRAAEQLAKVAIMKKSLKRVSDLHGLEDARF